MLVLYLAIVFVAIIFSFLLGKHVAMRSITIGKLVVAEDDDEPYFWLSISSKDKNEIINSKMICLKVEHVTQK